MIELKTLHLKESATFRDALKVTSRGIGIGFVVDENAKFQGVITDGDIRQALIGGANIDDAIVSGYNQHPIYVDAEGKLNDPAADLSRVYILPVVSDDARVLGYKTVKEFKKTAFITGITGQDGAYLAWFLLNKGYRVVGGYRRASTSSLERLERLGIKDKVELVSFDLIDISSIIAILERFEPQEIYNLAAQSFVQSSFSEPLATVNYTGTGVVNILEAIRLTDPSIKFYQASSSEMYGKVQEMPQTEHTPFYPRSPYGVAKLFGHWMTVNYRESYDLFACSGILFNHESPLRGLEFVTRKITYTAAQIKAGLQDELRLGNIHAERDWGYALDYVQCMWMMLQQDRPDDFVIATGQKMSVLNFVETAFDYLDLDYEKYLKIDRKYLRPSEVDKLMGNPDKAVEVLKWAPQQTPFNDLVKIMIDADMALLEGNASLSL